MDKRDFYTRKKDNNIKANCEENQKKLQDSAMALTKKKHFRNVEKNVSFVSFSQEHKHLKLKRFSIYLSQSCGYERIRT